MKSLHNNTVPAALVRAYVSALDNGTGEAIALAELRAAVTLTGASRGSEEPPPTERQGSTGSENYALSIEVVRSAAYRRGLWSSWPARERSKSRS